MFSEVRSPGPNKLIVIYSENIYMTSVNIFPPSTATILPLLNIPLSHSVADGPPPDELVAATTTTRHTDQGGILGRNLSTAGPRNISATPRGRSLLQTIYQSLGGGSPVRAVHAGAVHAGEIPVGPNNLTSENIYINDGPDSVAGGPFSQQAFGAGASAGIAASVSVVTPTAPSIGSNHRNRDKHPPTGRGKNFPLLPANLESAYRKLNLRKCGPFRPLFDKGGARPVSEEERGSLGGAGALGGALLEPGTTARLTKPRSGFGVTIYDEGRDAYGQYGGAQQDAYQTGLPGVRGGYEARRDVLHDPIVHRGGLFRESGKAVGFFPEKFVRESIESTGSLLVEGEDGIYLPTRAARNLAGRGGGGAGRGGPLLGSSKDSQHLGEVGFFLCSGHSIYLMLI